MAPVFDDPDEEDELVLEDVAEEVDEAVDAVRATVVAKMEATAVSLKPPSGCLIVAPPEPLLVEY